MVERVSWFSPVDYEIFLFFENHDIEATGNVISKNIDYDRQYVNKRLQKLADADLLVREDGFYFLSDRGRGFLNGDVEPESVEEPDD
jgi:predicted transcriptional regulator